MKMLKKFISAAACQLTLGLCFTLSFANQNKVPVDKPIQFTGFSDAAITWTRDFGDGQITKGIENPAHIFSNPGVYKVTLSTSNGPCTEQQEQIIEAVATDISFDGNGVMLAQRSIFLNPTTEIISLTIENIDETQYEVSSSDLSGKIVMKESFTAGNNKLFAKLSVINLASGIYFVEVTGKQEGFSTRFIKK